MWRLLRTMFHRPGRPGWYIRILRGDRERWVALVIGFNKKLEQARALTTLQQILGHASIVTTQRYARLTDEAVMREAQRIGRVSGVVA